MVCSTGESKSPPTPPQHTPLSPEQWHYTTREIAKKGLEVAILLKINSLVSSCRYLAWQREWKKKIDGRMCLSGSDINEH